MRIEIVVYERNMSESSSKRGPKRRFTDSERKQRKRESNAKFEQDMDSILLRFLNVLTSLNGFIIKRIVFLFLVKYIASGTLKAVKLNKIYEIFKFSVVQREDLQIQKENSGKENRMLNLSRIWIGDQCDRWNEHRSVLRVKTNVERSVQVQQRLYEYGKSSVGIIA
jgi:hypothetical protein